MFDPLLAFDIWSMHLPTAVALGAVATIGYLFGRSRPPLVPEDRTHARRELKRARGVARELETIAETVRRNLATHQASVARFKERVIELSAQDREAAWKTLCAEAEEMLKPTLRLATEISHAYDSIRQQSTNLMTFTEVRTDSLTGVSNRRALDESLASMFAMMHRYEHPFSIVILDIDHFKKINDECGHLHGDRKLRDVAGLLDETVRETDIVARYGGEEFVIVLPHTDLEGACVFGERLRRLIHDQLSLTISGGVTAAVDGDSVETLMNRADEALYSAKAAGRNRVYQHDATDIRSVTEAADCDDAAEEVSAAS